MKKLTTFAAVASIAAVHTGSIIFAQDAETVIPEIAICEAAPEIAVCPEPCIFPETPEICILPPTAELPTEGPISVDIHIDPIVEIPSDIELTDGSEGSVDENEVMDSGDSSEIPSDPDSTEGSDGESDENEVVDSSDPNADHEVTTTVEDDSVDFEKGVPIEWVKRGGTNVDSMYYSMAGNPAPVLEKEDAPYALAGNSVSDNLAPSRNTEEAPNALARGLGQDDKAAAIKTKANAASSKILSEKNEPTALIKKGRVFLR